MTAAKALLEIPRLHFPCPEGLISYCLEKTIAKTSFFFTTFDVGKGEKLYSNGIVLYDQRWYNLNQQATLPSVHWKRFSKIMGIMQSGVSLRANIVNHKAYNGGASLEITRNGTSTQAKSNLYPLFYINVAIVGNFVVEVIYSTDREEKWDFGLILVLEDNTELHLPATFTGLANVQPHDNRQIIITSLHDMPLFFTGGWRKRAYYIKCGNLGTLVKEVYFLSAQEGSNAVSANYSVCLGQLAIYPNHVLQKTEQICSPIKNLQMARTWSTQNIFKPLRTQHKMQEQREFCHVTLQWKTPRELLNNIKYFDIYQKADGGDLWIGRTFTQPFTDLDGDVQHFHVIPEAIDTPKLSPAQGQERASDLFIVKAIDLFEHPMETTGIFLP